MDKEEMELEFNEKIMQALMKKVQVSDARLNELEKNLGVKEAELQYLAKLYDEKITLINIELEDERSKAAEMEDKLNEMIENFSAKDAEISNLTNKLNEYTTEINSLNQQIEKMKNEIENAHGKIDEQETVISQQETKIQAMSEDIKNKAIIIEEQTIHFEALEMELKKDKSPETASNEASNSDRVKCKNCGSVGKDIKIVEDKTKALSYVGNMPMYAKIHVCKKCGNTF